MEDDEYCYGFNSDMFDESSASFSSGTRGGSNGGFAAARTPVEPKRLDVHALSRFWWSERRLNDFRRGAQRRVKEYHHVAAKLDGTRIDGGLGSAFLVPKSRVDGREVDGGVLWIQAPTSDSNAQAKRKKEIQDITNRQDALKTPKGSSKSTATVFLGMSEIIEATETRVQNTVHGIKFTLRSGPQFEFAFMPGPFFHQKNRDEMLEAFNRQQLDDAFSPESSPASSSSSPAVTPAVLEVSSSARSMSRTSSRTLSPVEPPSRHTSREPTPRTSPIDTQVRFSAVSVPVQDRKEYQRALVRQYVRYGELSTEAIEIAKQIHLSTNYLVGPLLAQSPNVSTDLPARRQLWSDLPRGLEQMQRDMHASEKERLNRTQARGSKDGDDTLSYTDTKTLQPITAEAYQERYMSYIAATQPDMDPVIRVFEPRAQVVTPVDVQPQTRNLTDGSMVLFGIDFSGSSFIDAAFLTSWKAITCPSTNEFSEWVDIVDESVVTSTYEDISACLTQLTEKVATLSANPLSSTRGRDNTTTELASVRPERRAGGRRRSIDQPSLEDLRSHFTRAESASDDIESPTKRRRSDGDASLTTDRRRRRQSLVAATDPSLLEEKTEDSGSCVQAMDSICPLCCDADAVVVMKPCGHSVCEGCWNRLGYPDDRAPTASEDVRQCPWDRKPVIKR